MSTLTTFLVLVLAIVVANDVNVTSNHNEVVRVLSAMKWVKGRINKAAEEYQTSSIINDSSNFVSISDECVKLYEDSESRLARLLASGGHEKYYYSHHDVVTWLSAALASHRSCLDGLEEKGLATFVSRNEEARNLTMLLKDALFHHRQQMTTLTSAQTTRGEQLQMK